MQALNGISFMGLITSTALVVSNGALTAVKVAARLAKVVFGDRIQICNGIDDHLKIQAAISALPAVGGEVAFLEGTYTLDATGIYAIHLESKSNIRLRGIGKVIFKLANAQNARILVLRLSNDISVENIEFDGNKANQTSAQNAVETRGSYNIRFKNCIFHDAYGAWGLLISEDATIPTPSYNVVVEGCNAYANGQGGMAVDGSSYWVSFVSCFSWENDTDGFRVESGDRCSFSSCYAWNNSQASAGARHGFSVSNEAKYISFIGCLAQDTQPTKTQESGFYLYGDAVEGYSDYGIVKGCKAIGNRGTGFQFVTVTGWVIEGNTAEGNGSAGIVVSSKGQHTIIGNSIFDNSYIGLYVRSTSNYNTIIGNQIYNNGDDGIRIEDSEYNLIKGNIVRGHTNAGVYGVDEDGTADNNIIEGNDLSGNTSPAEIIGANTVGSILKHSLSRSIWVQPHHASGTNAVLNSNLGDYGVAIADPDNTNNFYFSLALPTGFRRLEKAVVVLVAAASGVMRINAFTDVAKAGEVYNFHSDATAATDVNFTAGQIYEFDIKSAFDAFAQYAGDRVGVDFQRQGGSVYDVNTGVLYILGLLIEYT